MASPNFIARGPLTIVRVTRTVTSLQTQTSTAVFVTSIISKSPIHGPNNVTHVNPPIIIETMTSRLVTVLTATLTLVSTITEIRTTPTLTPAPATVPAVTPVLHNTPFPSVQKTLPGNSATPGTTTPSSDLPHNGATSGFATSLSPGSSFPESSGPKMSSTVTLLSTNFVGPSTAFPSLPSGHETEESNKTLMRILPSVLLPILSIIILAGFIFLKRRRKRRLTSIPALSPFNPRNAPRASTFHRNVFAMKKQRRTTADAGEEALDIWRRPGGLSGQGDRDALNDSHMEGNALPVVSEGPELPVAGSDNLLVPASRSEILELQTRLADIEARRISLPPPEYSSQRG